MSFVYVQRTGSLYGPDQAKIGTGYSGHGHGLNNPAEQGVIRVGPIPIGGYTVGPAKDPPDHLGPIAMPLEPDPGNQMFGRSAFFMHGDNSAHNHTASDGCIIMGPAIRTIVDDSDDDDLLVVAEERDVSAAFSGRPVA